jgi:hypothetical protein
MNNPIINIEIGILTSMLLASELNAVVGGFRPENADFVGHHFRRTRVRS